MEPSRWRAVIFDMDGVLVDNSPYYAAAWVQFLTENADLARSDFPAQQTFGRRNADLLPEVFGRPLSLPEIDRLGNRLEELYLERFLPHLVPMPGLIPLLDGLQRAGIATAVASSAPRRNVSLIVERLGLNGRFAFTLSESDVLRGKPDPQIYRLAAQRLGCSAGECLVFEDALVGISAARGAGMTCVALASSYPDAMLREAGAALVIRDFQDERLAAWMGIAA